jgi:hypothetical protein
MLQTKAYKVIIYILKIFVYRNVVLIYFLHTPNKDLEQGPSWEASHSASQWLICFLWNQMFTAAFTR